MGGGGIGTEGEGEGMIRREGIGAVRDTLSAPSRRCPMRAALKDREQQSWPQGRPSGSMA
eukprot:8436467-Pyramimonas_sp.AAC.1